MTVWERTSLVLRRHSKSIRRGAILLGILLALELIVFGGYFSGAVIPPLDFLGGYNTDAYYWWQNGGFFTPLEWLPTTWAGFPSAVNIQNSSWYLPVGLANALAPFTLHSSAILSALHVGLGFIGVFLLIRALRVDYKIALTAAIASFFGVGYFTNAEHVDIARGYALIPWILLTISPRWPWAKMWSIPVAAFILWQAATGIYPGMAITTIYVGVVWVIVWQLQGRSPLRNYLIPLLIAVVSAALLSAPRILPFLLLREPLDYDIVESSIFVPTMIGTLLFGYESNELPNSMSMRSFFIPATMIALAFLSRWRDPVFKLGLALVLPSFILGMPFWPWFDASQSLPGLGISRFTMSDFKVFMILGIILLACSGMSSLLATGSQRLTLGKASVRLAALVVFAGILGEIGRKGPYAREDWLPQLLVFGTVITLIFLAVLWRSRSSQSRAIISLGLIILTAASGILWTSTNTHMWQADRVEAEELTYGSSVSDLMKLKAEATDTVQRPARTPVADRENIYELYNMRWNRGAFSGENTVGGYRALNLSLTQQQLTENLVSDLHGNSFMALLAAPGIVSGHDTALPSESEIDKCVSTGDCGSVQSTPISYSPGKLQYDVSLIQDSRAILNEAYYPGWTATICSDSQPCQSVPVSRSETSLVQLQLPQGHFHLTLKYVTPGRTVSWVLFATGVALAAVSGLIVGLRRRNGAAPHRAAQGVPTVLTDDK